jgi:transcriptional regulator with XRE-family HTH domain
MEARKPSPSAGERLRALRKGLGLSTRDVEEKSQRIAEEMTCSPKSAQRCI